MEDHSLFGFILAAPLDHI